MSAPVTKTFMILPEPDGKRQASPLGVVGEAGGTGTGTAVTNRVERAVSLQTVSYGGGLLPRIGNAFKAFSAALFSPMAPMAPPEVSQAEGARTFQYTSGYNINYTPRAAEGLTPFDWMLNIARLFDTLNMSILYRQEELSALDWEIVPRNPKKPPSDAQLSEARERLEKPDGETRFGQWISSLLWEALVTDAVSIFVNKSLTGEVLSFDAVDGSTIKPLVGGNGRVPTIESGAPAYQQVMYGRPIWEGTKADLIYAPKNRRPRSAYGNSPTEMLILTTNRALRRQGHDINYYCYDDQTEVLTRDGWKRFEFVQGTDQVATRSVEGRFEWQTPTEVVHQPYSGELLRFKNRQVDLLVTPNHRMQVRRKYTQDVRAWRIERADSFIGRKQYARYNEMPATSSWEGVEQVEKVIAAPKLGRSNSRTEEVRMPMKTWMAFLGLYLAEGSVTWRTHRRSYGAGEYRYPTISIAQAPHSERRDEIVELLTETGLQWGGTEKSWNIECHNQALARELMRYGQGSANKHLCTEEKDSSPALLEALFEGMMLGDGTVTANGQRRYITTSGQLADDLQEVLQKTGVSASVICYEAQQGRYENALGVKPYYFVNELIKEAHEVPLPVAEAYVGDVHCVSVPNGIIYVRRNGRAIWCGNTAGNIPDALVAAPAEWSQTQIENYQGWFDTVVAQPTNRRKLWFLPTQNGRLNVFQFRPPVLDTDVERFLDQRVFAMIGVSPQALGFMNDVNRSQGAMQENIEFRRRLPFLRYFGGVIMDMLDLANLPDCMIQFAGEKPDEDKLAQARADDIALRNGTISTEDIHQRQGIKPIGQRYVYTATGPVAFPLTPEQIDAQQTPEAAPSAENADVQAEPTEDINTTKVTANENADVEVERRARQTNAPLSEQLAELAQWQRYVKQHPELPLKRQFVTRALAPDVSEAVRVTLQLRAQKPKEEEQRWIAATFDEARALLVEANKEKAAV